MNGYRTTFAGIVGSTTDSLPEISGIEIPIIQRDYAQGRQEDAVAEIRHRFVRALTGAARGGDPVELDFIYGEVADDGTLRPLDGQQRLTTLFLLHWYVASRAGRLDDSLPWPRFSYATRPSARDFCDALRRNPLAMTSAAPSVWITDQPWYVHPWRNDPTIQSMLVMLDEIHDAFDEGDGDFPPILHRLFDTDSPAISFLFLSISDTDRGGELYVKMNSRGRPLTPYEIFKSELESLLRPVLSNETNSRLVRALDYEWANLLWLYERRTAGDYEIDDEFMRYFEFIVDVCEWRDGAADRRWTDEPRTRKRTLEDRSALAFADPSNPSSPRNRAFLFHAFDTWSGEDSDPEAVFSRLFRTDGRGVGPLPLLASSEPDLFRACITGYGETFTVAETLMLFAVLLARESGVEGPALERRLRTLRNLTESSNLDTRRVADYARATERLIVEGALEDSVGFNQGWVADELLKWELMDVSPEVTPALHALEDESVIRGRLLAFDLDVDALPRRARTFAEIAGGEVRDLVAAALLTKGDYSRDVGWDGARRQIGNSQQNDSWRDLLTATTRAEQEARRTPLMLLLDDVADRLESDGSGVESALSEIAASWLLAREREEIYDWRWYLVKYGSARSNVGQGYIHGSYDPTAGGFKLGNLRLLHGSNYNAYFSDVILRAVWDAGHLDGIAEHPSWWHHQDLGMSFGSGSLEMKNRDEGFEIVVRDESSVDMNLLSRNLGRVPGSDAFHVLIPQGERAGSIVDRSDRVKIGVDVAATLATAVRASESIG